MKKNFAFILFLAFYLLYALYAIAKDNDKNANKISVKGSKKLVNGRYRAAEKQYTDALEINPSHELYFKRGCARYQTKNFKEALIDFHKAILINPSFSEAYNYRGIVRLELGDTSDALMDHNKAIELNPNYADGYYQRAFVKMQMGMYHEALLDYNKAIMLSPTTAHGYMFLNRGYNYYFLRKYHEAYNDIANAEYLMPENPYVFKIKALTQIAMGKNNDACKSFSEAFGLGYTEAYGNDLEKIARKNCR